MTQKWLEVEVLTELSRIELKVNGELSLPFLWKVMAAVEATPGTDPTYDLLFDGSGLDVEHADVEEISRFEGKVPTRRSRLAIVAPSDLQFGVGKMYEAWSQQMASREMQIFRDVDQARAWLGGG